MDRNRIDITVIVPTLNEEEGIGPTLKELRDILGDPHLLVIDGNSTDNTIKIAKDMGAEILIQKGIGKGAALLEAFRYDGVDSDYIIMIDADGSMDPKEIPLFIQALKSGADIAKGSRFLHSAYSKDLSSIRRIGNRIMVFLVNLIWSTNYTDLCYGFMAFKKEALKNISKYLSSRGFEIETEICIKAKKLGLKVVEVPSVELKRRYGRSRLRTFRDGLRILVKIIREMFD